MRQILNHKATQAFLSFKITLKNIPKGVEIPLTSMLMALRFVQGTCDANLGPMSSNVKYTSVTLYLTLNYLNFSSNLQNQNRN